MSWPFAAGHLRIVVNASFSNLFYLYLRLNVLIVSADAGAATSRADKLHATLFAMNLRRRHHFRTRHTAMAFSRI